MIFNRIRLMRSCVYGVALTLLVCQGHFCSLLAGGSKLVQESGSDEEACYIALTDLKESKQLKDDIAFFFGYLSGRLKVTLPNRWKQAFQGILSTEHPREDFPSNRVFEGEKELSDSEIDQMGISSFVSRSETRCLLVTPDKHKANLLYTTSFTNWTSSFDVKCIDKNTKSIIWSQKVLSRWRGDGGFDWNYVDLVSTTESVFVFGFSSCLCYIERIDAQTGQTTLTFYSAPMDFPRWETHHVLPPREKNREEPKTPVTEKLNTAPKK